jgi:hypothetical protein
MSVIKLNNKKPTARLRLAVGIGAWIKRTFLSQQPSRASAHACTTTSTTAGAGEIEKL